MFKGKGNTHLEEYQYTCMGINIDDVIQIKKQYHTLSDFTLSSNQTSG